MKRRLLALLLACGAVGSNAHAVVWMTDENDNSIGSSHYSITWVGTDNDGKAIYDVIIKSTYRSGGANSVFVIHGNGGENIGTVSMQAAADSYPNNYIVIRVKSDGGSGIKDLYQVSRTTGGTEGAVLHLVDIERSVGSVSIDAIGDIYAGGDILGPIESTGEHTNGGITKLKCDGTSGSILGDITSVGTIKWVEAVNGDIGASGSPIAISCTALENYVIGESVYATITATSGNVGLIQATKTSGGELVADISAQNILNTGGGEGILVNGDLDLTLSLAGGMNPSIRDDVIITGGDFTENSTISAWGIGDYGDFTIIRVSDGMGGYVGGYFKGDIAFTGNWSEHSVLSIDEALQGTINIGQSLSDAVTISDLSGSGEGLTGQVIINSLDGSGSWDGDVTVAGTTLSWSGNDPGEYTQTAATLGGGSVGLVPFSTHRESCSPAHGTVKKGAPASITLQFYGPVVQADEGTDMPVRVYRGDYGDDTFANDVDITDDCEVVMHPGGDPRKVRINPVGTQFRPKYRYHLVPITSSPGTGETILLCDGLLASGDVPVKGRDSWVDVDIT